MSDLPGPLARLVERLVHLPGIGRRSAARIAFHLARQPADEVRALAETIGALPDGLGPCRNCGNLAASGTGDDRCPVCADPRRDGTVVCVVEGADNLAAIERTGAYRGIYHVLGGAISPLRGIGPDDLRILALLDRLREGVIREVILATNPTVEGEATALYIARQVEPLGIPVTRPATGLPVGGDLDYIDLATLTRALEGRRRL